MLELLPDYIITITVEFGLKTVQKTYEHIYIWTNYLIRLVGFQNRHHHCVLLEKWVLMIYNMSYNNNIPIWLKRVYISLIVLHK